jgi:DNA-binding transcriptional LysR family regulator
MEYKSLPDINGWATLRAVVEKGGVAAAASAMNVGQPAITKRLRALDTTYGTPLMERIGGRLRLTPAGEKVYLLAVQTLDRQQILRDELAVLAHGQKFMRLEATLSIGEHLLPGLLLQFAEQYADFKVQSRMTYGRRIEAHLATDQTDLALMESAPDHPDILVQKWMDDELWLVCGPDHRLAGTELLPVEELEKLNYVLREKNSTTRNDLDKALTNIGITQINVPLEVGSNDTIVEMLEHNRYVSFLPKFAVEEKVLDGDLFRIKVKGFRIMRTLWIARHRNKLDHPVVESFIKMLHENK